jgi:aldehyde oxidoreductase
MDRLAFRLKNALRDGDRPRPARCWKRRRHRRVPGGAAPALGQRAGRGSRGGTMVRAIRRGVGVASCWYGCGNTALPNPSTIRIGLTPHGRPGAASGRGGHRPGLEHGHRADRGRRAGRAARAFDLIGAGHRADAGCGKTSASRQTYVTGRAAQAAGAALRAEKSCAWPMRATTRDHAGWADR